MTEDEAKTKWCFQTVRIIDGATVKVGEDDPFRPIRCIASQCMAWRWTITPLQAASRDGKWQPEGFCGLAAKP